MYKTKFKGSFKLIDETPAEYKQKLKKFISNNFEDIINFELDSNMVYINGELDNTNEVIENFVYRVLKHIELKETVVIKAQGQDIKDRWDILINKEGMYIQNYKVVKDKIEKYK